MSFGKNKNAVFDFKVTLEAEHESDDDDIVTLMSADGEEIDFVRIATAEGLLGNYVILQPVELLEGMEDDEALVFEVKYGDGDDDYDDDDDDGKKTGEAKYEIVLDDDIIDSVFAAYKAHTVEIDENRRKCDEMCLSAMLISYPGYGRKALCRAAKAISDIVFDVKKPLADIAAVVRGFESETIVDPSKADDAFDRILRGIADDKPNAYRLYDLFFETLNETAFYKIVLFNRFNVSRDMYSRVIEYGKKHFDVIAACDG